jgi:hypothetical protein
MALTTKTILQIHQASLDLPPDRREAYRLRQHAALFASLKGSNSLATRAITPHHDSLPAGLVSAPNLAAPNPANISGRRK